MARALSDDLRIRVLIASAAGMSARQAAGRFGVGRGDLEEVTENGTYETRVMKPKTRTRRRTAHKIVIPGKDESEPTVEQEPDNTGDSE